MQLRSIQGTSEQVMRIELAVSIPALLVAKQCHSNAVTRALRAELKQAKRHLLRIHADKDSFASISSL